MIIQISHNQQKIAQALLQYWQRKISLTYRFHPYVCMYMLMRNNSILFVISLYRVIYQTLEQINNKYIAVPLGHQLPTIFFKYILNNTFHVVHVDCFCLK